MTQSTAATGERVAARWLTPSLDPPAVAAWLLPFVLILLLAFSGGGYDPIVRGQTGIVVWWLVLVGGALGTVVVGGGRLAWGGVALLGAFTVWTAVGLTWTESTERTVTEIARVAALLGVFLLALASQRRVAARHAINGAACAIAVVAAAAVLSRLKPDLFGPQELDAIFPTSRRRLSFPLGYWNLLAGLAVMGVPLLLAAAGGARTTVGRALATAAVPVVVLCIFLTVSRGAVGGIAVAVALYLALAPDRLPKLGNALVAGAGSLVLCLAADNREALKEGLADAAARQQGSSLLGLCILVCVGVALLAAGVALADRHATRPRWSVPSRRVAGVLAAVALVIGAGAFVAADGPGRVSDRVTEFKAASPAGAGSFDNAVTRLQNVNGNGRYQFWQSARRAEETAPLTGIGPGTFEYWWARDGTIDGGFVRDAHSLWFQTLGETGIVGLGLIAGFFGLALIGGAVRTLRARDPEHRIALAAAVAGVGGFVACASIEWAWQMTVLPVAALGLVAVALAGREEPRLLPRPEPAPPVPARAGLAVLAAVAIAAVGIPTAAASDLRDSQVQAADGDLTAALDRAASAADLQPYSASAQLQEALVLERVRQFPAAVAAATRATEKEPTNWRTWVVRSRLEARAGNGGASLRSYERARSLNPRSALFLTR